MKPFRFNLTVIQTLRKRQEQAAMEVYAQALAARQTALSNLAAADREVESACCEWHSAVADGSSAAWVSRLQDYFQTVRARHSACVDAMQQAEVRVAEALNAMLAARREREVVDRFRDLERQAYDRELQREEAKVLDEMAQLRRTPSGLGRCEEVTLHE